MVGHEILEVLYSPVNAFRKIIEKPDFKGVLLVLVLVIASTIALQFVYNSKQLYETRAPANDNWTEALTNQYVWTSTGSLSLDATTYQMGNRSISASAIDATSILLKLDNIDSLNCSGPTGYTGLIFSINWSNEDGFSASLGTIRLFSGNEDSYFETSLVNLLASNRAWGNVTLNVGPNQGWVSNNSPSWENINGVELELVWSESSNLTINIDGLFFNTFISPLESVGFSESMVYILFSVSLSVGMNWILWAGILVIVSKLFGEELAKWNDVFVIFGHAFIVTAVYTLVSALIFTSLPILNMPIEADLQIAAFSALWLPNLGYQAGTIILWAGEVWIAALGAIIIRLMRNVPWGKAATIAVIAFSIRFVLRFFFGF